MSLWAWILRGGAAVYLHTGYPRYIVPVNRGYEGYEQRYELNTKYPLDYLPANSILRQTTGENKRFVMALGVEIKQRLTGQKLWDNCNHLATFIKAGYIRRAYSYKSLHCCGAAPGQYLLSPTQVLPASSQQSGAEAGPVLACAGLLHIEIMMLCFITHKQQCDYL